MYKNIDLKDINSFKNSFVKTFAFFVSKSQAPNISAFFRLMFKEWESVYFCESNNVSFKISMMWDDIELIDEKEKIRVILKGEDKYELWNMIKPILQGKKQKNISNDSIEKMILNEFKNWYFKDLLDKPFLIYDIETSMWNNNDWASFKYYLWYYMESDGQKMAYHYVGQEDLEKFVDYMLNFDGYIIGFNSIGFDNPVSIYNTKWSLEEFEKKIEELNKKSLDIYLFVRNLTKKRLSLNKMAEWLIWVSKTLESWAEWSKMFEEYLSSWNEELLEEVKKYCKNDVRMTALVFLYLLYFKKINIWDTDYPYTIDDFIALSNNVVEEEIETQTQSLF